MPPRGLRRLIRAETLFLINLSVGAPVEIGTMDGVGHRCIPILGGTVSGAFEGTVLPGGADWQQIRRDGTLDIEARYVLCFADDRVEVESRGIRTGSPAILARLAAGEAVHPAEYYFRTFVQFRTGSERLARLNHILAVATGERLSNQVRLIVREVE